VHRRTRAERRHLLLRLAALPGRLAVRALAVLPHRGPTHSLAACALVTALALALLGGRGAGLAIGWCAHVAADACTRGGVRLLWPAGARDVGIPRALRVRSGGLADIVVRVAFAALAVLALAHLAQRS
jgi:membrane-bound metal-dependent hydrolase YbcI (DUF457 family)